MALKFCDCQHLLKVLTSAKSYVCSKCEKRYPFESGDTLIREPAIRPVGFEKNKHIIDHMDRIPLMPFVETGKNIECPRCKKKMVRYAILDNITWYRCTFDDCRHLFQ